MNEKRIYVFFLLLIGILLLLTQNIVKKDNINSNTNKSDSLTSIKMNKNNEIQDINLEDYILGVLGCEMPALFETEALKAGAVAARTYILNKLENNENYVVSSTTNDQCYNDEEELKEKWKDEYTKYINKLKEVIEQTKGEYMTYNGQIIKALYFSTSNGKTEDVKNVFGEELDYLVSVDSPYDINTSQFNKTIEIEKSDFLEKLNLPYSNDIIIKDVIKNESNRVDYITINDVKFKGTQIRTLLNLRSTDFEILTNNNLIYINTKGYGHGVGMSQYGANELAKIGYNYEEILKYYYKGVDITK